MDIKSYPRIAHTYIGQAFGKYQKTGIRFVEAVLCATNRLELQPQLHIKVTLHIAFYLFQS